MLNKAWSACLPFLLLAASPVSGQVRFEITPFGGLNLVLTDVWEANALVLADIETDVEQAILEETGEFINIELDEATAKHKMGFLFGGRLTLWLGGKCGLEGSFAYAMTDVEATVSGSAPDLGEIFSESEDDSGNLWLASLKGLYRSAAGPGAPVLFHLGGGLTLLGRGGDAWRYIDGTTDYGGVLNLGVTFDAGGRLAIRVDAEDYFYSAEFEFEDEEIGESKFQNDLVFTGGLVIKLDG
jgi:hypothetical protein